MNVFVGTIKTKTCKIEVFTNRDAREVSLVLVSRIGQVVRVGHLTSVAQTGALYSGLRGHAAPACDGAPRAYFSGSVAVLEWRPFSRPSILSKQEAAALADIVVAAACGAALS